MANTWEDIVSTINSRRSNDSNLIRRMQETSERYHNRIVIPIPDMTDKPGMSGLMPQIVHDGIEGAALRASGPLPTIDVPSIHASKKTAIQNADRTQRALYGTWADNAWDLQSGRWFRQLAGYATFAAVVVPDFKKEIVRIETRDPLTAYPDPRAGDMFDPPTDCGFVYGRSREWILSRYPESRKLIETVGKGRPRDGNDALWDMLEWIDADHLVIGILGPRQHATDAEREALAGGIELRRWPNRAGRTTVGCPRRITLSDVAGQMEHIYPQIDWSQKMMALETLAAEKRIFGDMVALAAENAVPEIISGNGEWQDGRTGQVNLLAGVRDVRQLATPDAPGVWNVMQELERHQRMSGGVSPLYGGNNPNGLRTGRAIDAIGGFAVDPNVAELQKIMARTMSTVINPSIIDTYKGYFGRKSFSMHSGWPGDHKTVEFTPNDHFDTAQSVVTYAFPGTDLSGITVAVGQLSGSGLMSKRTARTKHPFIDDAEGEEAQVAVERLRDSLMVTVQQRGTNGELAEIDIAHMIKKILDGDPVEDAVISADEQARKRQASEAEQVDIGGQMVEPGAQPGLANAGIGAESRPGPLNRIAEPEQSMQNFRQILNTLRS